MWGVAGVESGDKQRREADGQGTEEDAVGEGEFGNALQGERHKEQCRYDVKRHTENPGVETFLPEADPDNGRGFQRPAGGGPVPVERIGNGECDENDAERQKGFGEEAHVPLLPEQFCQQQVETTHEEGAERECVFDLSDQGVLKCKGRQRHAEYQCRVDETAKFEGLFVGKKDADPDIEEKEEDQERFGRIEKCALIAQKPPCGCDDEGEEKAGDVEDAPCAVPGDDDDAEIEQCVVAEQQEVRFAVR